MSDYYYTIKYPDAYFIFQEKCEAGALNSSEKCDKIDEKYLEKCDSEWQGI